MDRGYFNTGFSGRWACLHGILAGIAGGMEYVHAKRILHGDLNPSNILLKVRLHYARVVQCFYQYAESICRVQLRSKTVQNLVLPVAGSTAIHSY